MVASPKIKSEFKAKRPILGANSPSYLECVLGISDALLAP